MAKEIKILRAVEGERKISGLTFNIGCFFLDTQIRLVHLFICQGSENISLLNADYKGKVTWHENYIAFVPCIIEESKENHLLQFYRMRISHGISKISEIKLNFKSILVNKTSPLRDLLQLLTEFYLQKLIIQQRKKTQMRKNVTLVPFTKFLFWEVNI